MQHDEFEGYLRALPELGDRAVGDCLSRCKRLEKHEGIWTPTSMMTAWRT